jgi:TolB-like protein/Tfp pilus assembly protein PilF
LEPGATVQSIAQFYREARRRKVFRTAALYVLGSWAVLQVADVLFPGFGIPETAIQALVWAAVLGFPVALIFGWLFEVGPGGVRRTQPRSAAESAEPLPLGRRDYLLLAAFAVIGAILIFRAVQEVRRTPVATASDVVSAESKEGARLPNSIAVLPFTNISSDPENEYFCDGISEEILNEISTVRDVNVIGRTSSFAFKGSNVGIERISATLGVHYVLQGSVRKSEARLRISAQLLDERGRQLWTQTFDRELADVFEIQQDIARAVAAQVARQVESRPESAPRPSLEAYDRYLAGRELLHHRDIDGAMTELQRAIDLDPGFAEAQAEWAIARSIGAPSKQDLDAAAAAIDRALELRPHLLRAEAARGLWLLQLTPPDAAAAESVLRGVLEQDPNMSDALLWLSNALQDMDRREESLEILQRAARIDPLHPSIAGNLANLLLESGDDEAALHFLERQLQQPNPRFDTYWSLVKFYRLRGELVELNAVAKDFTLHGGGDAYLSIALSYALLGDLSAAEHWTERSLKDFPVGWLSPYTGALVPGWRGDPERARQQFEQAMRSAGVRIEEKGFNIRYWYGGLLARSRRYEAAIELLEPLAAGAATPMSLYLDYAPEFDGWHALAWSYRHSGQEAKATRILSALLEGCRSQLDDRQHPAPSNLLFFCAENALMAGDAEQALALLERAVKAGWRDYYVRRNDPYWAALENDPRYRALMETVKLDVDRQRAEVARIDATDGFMARLDAAMAAPRASTR